MKYSDFQTALSIPRIDKYKDACGGDKNKALILYRWNINLCQEFYGVLGAFEVVLRNAIDRHYASILTDPNWLDTKANDGTFQSIFSNKINTEIIKLRAEKRYTHNRLVASLSFGTWTALFTRNNYRALGSNLLAIFPHRTHGLGQAVIYNELSMIRVFRNRIAHYEPICFDSTGNIDAQYSENLYNLVIKYFNFLGYNENEILWGISKPQNTILKIKEL